MKNNFTVSIMASFALINIFGLGPIIFAVNLEEADPILRLLILIFLILACLTVFYCLWMPFDNWLSKRKALKLNIKKFDDKKK